MDQKPPTAVIEAANRAHLSNLPFADTADFTDADRGFIAALEPCVVKAADGRVVWDNDVYSFLSGDAPPSVHPSLWRQSQLVAKQGLYEVVEGVYQVRGLDLSNISFIEGDTGIIVIDPLVSTETAAAALGAVPRPSWRPARRRRHLHPQPRRPLRRRARCDDAGGRRRGQRSRSSRRNTSPNMPCRRTCTQAPRWRRRAGYMYGAVLARGPQGQVGCGLGQVGVDRARWR